MAEKQRESGLKQATARDPEGPVGGTVSQRIGLSGCSAGGLQLAAIRTRGRRGSQFLSQRLAAFSARKPALPYAVEARFVSIDG